jgi:hypothetical protein
VRSAFAEETDYAKVLFMVSGLEEGVNHTLTMTNLEDGKWFGFDYAQVSNPPAPRYVHLSSSDARFQGS